jgi:Glycosyltransferase family 87
LVALAAAAVFVLLGLLVALHFCLGASGRNTRWVHGTFLFNPGISYSDLTYSTDESRHSDPYFETHSKPRLPGWISNYFPFTYQVLGLVRGWSHGDIIRVFVESSVGAYLLIAVLAGLLYGKDVPGAVAMALFMSVVALASYPFLFAVDRGNLETYTAALCFLSMLFLAKDMPLLGAPFLALAIALKGYPLVLCLVFAGKGSWRAGLLAALVAVALSLEALFSLSGGIVHNVQGLMNGLRGYLQFCGSGAGAASTADPYDALLIIGFCRPRLFPSLLPCVGVLCQVCMELVVAACAVYAVRSRAPFHRRLLAATLGMMFIPTAIVDYKLLYLVMLVFFMAVEEQAWSRADFIAFGSLLFLLVPKQYYFLRPDISMSCLISPIFVLLLLGTLAWDRPGWKSVWQGAQ